MAGNTAARVGSINVLLQTQLGGAVNGLNTFATEVERTGTRSARAVAGIDRSVASLNRSFSSISPRGLQTLTVSALRAQSGLDQLRGLALAASAAMAGLLPAGIAAGFVQVADRAHRMENALRTVTTSTGDLKNLQEELFQVSQRSRSGFESTVTLYARTARATEQLGLSQEKLLNITETVQKAFAIGGASTAEAQGAAIQLSQGIASDRFSGEEFRSVAENAPVLLQGMAKALGVGIGQLREMAHAGELTASVVTEAILAANEDIEASFAKTSSTIMQAVQMVDNELLKFASNSSEVSAASSAIVGILKVVGDNVENIAAILAILAVRWGAAFGARQISSLTGMVTGLRQARLESLAAAAAASQLATAQMKAARAEFVQKRLEFNKALATATTTTSQLAREKKSLAAASAAYQAASVRATAATVAHSRALDAARISATGFAVAGRAAAAVWSFIGGPIGAAVLALSAGMYLIAQRAQETAARTDRYSDAIGEAGRISEQASGSIRRAGESLAFVAGAATEAERMVRLGTATNDLSLAMADLFSATTRVAEGLNSAGWTPVSQEVFRLAKGIEQGTVTSEELARALDEIARSRPDLAPAIAEMQRLAAVADATRGAVDALSQAIRNIGGASGKGDRLTGLGRAQLDYNEALALAKRIGIDGITKDGTEKIKTKKGGGRSRASADDRFDQSVQSVYDRIEALRLEREALNLTYFEQVKREEALKLEQEALKQAREEARRKGVEDWQSVQISAAKRAEIDRVAEAYAREAAATKKAKEEQEAYKTAASDLGGILRGIADGSMELEDALLEMGKVLLKLLNDMNLAGGGKGIFGGGWLQSLIGGFLGLSFHGGGTVGGQKAGAIPAAPYVGTAHEGRTIGGRKATHKEVLALLEKGETVFTAKDTGRIVDRLGAAANGMGSSDYVAGIRIVSDGKLNLWPEVTSIARQESNSAAGRVAKSVPKMVDSRMHTKQTRGVRA